MDKGTRVQIACSIDTSNPAKYIGQAGTVAKTSDGQTVDSMIIVVLDNGRKDAYWPEELKVL